MIQRCFCILTAVLLFRLWIALILFFDWFYSVFGLFTGYKTNHFLGSFDLLDEIFPYCESIISILLFHKKIELSMLFNTGQLIFSIERICEKPFISLPFILICQWIAVNL